MAEITREQPKLAKVETLLNRYAELRKERDNIQAQMDKLSATVQAFMEDKQLVAYSSDAAKVTLVPESTSIRINRKQLESKFPDVLKAVSTTVNKKGYVRITVRKDKEND